MVHRLWTFVINGKGDRNLMWSYFGSKSKIVKYYEPPKYDKIIEPFAGTAKYALMYYDKEVTLVEKYDVIYNIWKYLQDAHPADILSLPDVEPSNRIPKTGYQPADHLMYYCCSRGNALPGHTAGKFCNWNQNKEKIARDLYKIRHWKIIHGSYEDLKNEKATWFIDPPYQKLGYRYKHHDMNYPQLAKWCKSRQGQVIVCENEDGSWMDFKPLKKMTGGKHTKMEVVWYGETI